MAIRDVSIKQGNRSGVDGPILRVETNPLSMKKYLIIYALLVTGALLFTLRHYRGQTRRLAQNQEALASDLTHYRTRAGQEAAAAQVLRLRCAEFERLREADAEEIRRLGIRLRRLESTARTATASQLEIRAPIRDSLVVRHDTLGGIFPTVAARLDTLRSFRWEDPWTVVEGTLRNDSVTCRICSVDTLRQIVHRIPHRFLFIRWGTKALRQEIVSSNPHTRVVYAEYIRLER